MKLLLVLCMASGTAVFAGPLGSVSFDGLKSGEQVLDYYRGGFGGMNSGPGPLMGISFTSGLVADSTTIAFGNSARLTAPSVTMTLDNPFSGLFSFYFIGDGDAKFYSGPSGGGTLLATNTLSSTTTLTSGGPGAFQSVVFDTTSTLKLDSITFGGSVIPEPSGMTLLPLGIASVAGLRRWCGRRRR